MGDTEAATLQKLERRGRDLKGIWRWIFEIIAVGFVAFYIYGAGFGTSGEQYHVGLYLLLTFVLTGMLHQFKLSSPLSRPSLPDLILVGLTIFVIGYWIVEYKTLANRAGAYNQLDVCVGTVAVILSLEYSRRTVGWALTIIAAVGILYALFGQLMPSVIAHKGFPLRRIFEYSFFSQAGLFGIMANVMAT